MEARPCRMLLFRVEGVDEDEREEEDPAMSASRV